VPEAAGHHGKPAQVEGWDDLFDFGWQLSVRHFAGSDNLATTTWQGLFIFFIFLSNLVSQVLAGSCGCRTYGSSKL